MYYSSIHTYIHTYYMCGNQTINVITFSRGIRSGGMELRGRSNRIRIEGLITNLKFVMEMYVCMYVCMYMYVCIHTCINILC